MTFAELDDLPPPDRAKHVQGRLKDKEWHADQGFGGQAAMLVEKYEMRAGDSSAACIPQHTGRLEYPHASHGCLHPETHGASNAS